MALSIDVANALKGGVVLGGDVLIRHFGRLTGVKFLGELAISTMFLWSEFCHLQPETIAN
jgi:hypothetical protein